MSIAEKNHFDIQLIQKDKLASLGILASGMGHEIGNLISSINLNVPVLRDYLQELTKIIEIHSKDHPALKLSQMSYPEFREEIFKVIASIDHVAKQINKMIGALRSFSRIKTQKEERWVDLESLMETTLSICRGKIKNRVKTFTKNIPSDLPRVYTDPHYLEQVLINLLINAADASRGKDSWVYLSAEVGSDHTMIIEVIDNGCGMDEQTMGKIFDPFFTTKTPAQGMGLGLYICKILMESLGGRIEVKSRPGEGSTFRVILLNKESRKKKDLAWPSRVPQEAESIPMRS